MTWADTENLCCQAAVFSRRDGYSHYWLCAPVLCCDVLRCAVCSIVEPVRNLVLNKVRVGPAVRAMMRHHDSKQGSRMP